MAPGTLLRDAVGQYGEGDAGSVGGVVQEADQDDQRNWNHKQILHPQNTCELVLTKIIGSLFILGLVCF